MATYNITTGTGSATFTVSTGARGPAGKSAYQSYLDTTEDDPPLSEEAWSAATHAAAEKTTPADADEIPIADSAAEWVLKKLSWANLKTALAAVFPLRSNNLSDLANAATAFGNIKQAATTSASGVVQLATNGGTTAGQAVQANDSRLSDARTPTTHTHTSAQISDAVFNPSFGKLVKSDLGDAVISIGTPLENYYNGAWPDISSYVTARDGVDGNGNPVWSGTDGGSVTWSLSWNYEWTLEITDGTYTDTYVAYGPPHDPSTSYAAVGDSIGDFSLVALPSVGFPIATAKDMADSQASPRIMCPAQVNAAGNSAASNPGNLLAAINANVAQAKDALDIYALPTTEATAGRTLTPADNGLYIRCTNASAITLTIGEDGDYDWADDTTIYIRRATGAGALSFASNGVTVNNSGVADIAEGQVFALKRVEIDEWDFVPIGGGKLPTGIVSSSGVLQSVTATYNFASATPETGAALINTTAATSVNQCSSPSMVWAGQGWKTNATAGSQPVEFRAFVLPAQGTANPTATWVLQSSINGAAWVDAISITHSGQISSNSGLIQNCGTTSTFIAANGFLHFRANNFAATTTGDLILGRKSAANLRQGAADAAAPVAQTLSVQNVVAGTSNTAGANRTFAGSQGTGTGVGGDHIFTVATAGSSGTAQNPLVEALRIRQDRALFVANVSAEPATPTDGGILYVDGGALKFKGSSGTVTTIANA